jgi:hypothetical protein
VSTPRARDPVNSETPSAWTTEGATQNNNTTPESNPHSAIAGIRRCGSSQAISWWSVHEFAAPHLDRAGTWPMAGTPAWCAMPDDDPRKLAALLDAAQHWALGVETAQETCADASKAVAASADWPAVAQEIHQRQDFYSRKPWMKRASA